MTANKTGRLRSRRPEGGAMERHDHAHGSTSAEVNASSNFDNTLFDSGLQLAEGYLADMKEHLDDGDLKAAREAAESFTIILGNEKVPTIRAEITRFSLAWIQAHANGQGRRIMAMLGLREAPRELAEESVDVREALLEELLAEAGKAKTLARRRELLQTAIPTLAHLSTLALGEWRDRFCKVAKLSAGELNTLLAERRKADALKPDKAEAEEHTPQPRFTVKRGAFHAMEQSRDGNTYTRQLCNFTARIVSDVLYDNGQDRVRHFVITGASDTGQAFARCEVNSAAFGAMNWVMEHWGVSAIVMAGQSTRDKLREAIQAASAECDKASIYAHTGWRMIDGRRVYLHNGGALGMEGVSVQLDGRLSQYTLPPTLSGVNLRAAMRASVELVNAARHSVSFPLWGAMFLAPLAELVEPDFTLFPYGQSGALKSSYTAKMLCHYGNFTYKTLPESWESTANALLKHAFIVKDAPLVIDDYAPQASGVDSAKMETKAHMVLRAVGNRSARNRMAADTSDRPGYPPRGVLISTGEHLPSTESIAARLLPLEFVVDTKKQPATVYAKKLAKAQSESNELLQQAMAGYILWAGEQWDTLKRELPKRLDQLREELAGDVHLRTPAMFAQVLLGVHMGLTYAQTVGALSAEKAAEFWEAAKQTMRELSTIQASHVQAERPSETFLYTIRELLTQGKAYLRPTGEGPSHLEQGEFIGWTDVDFVYLLSEAAHRLVARHCREAGTPFTVKPTSLYKLLEAEGHLTPGPDKERRSTRAAGRRVIRLKRASLAELTGG